MTKNYSTPLNIQIINKGKYTDSFVPYKTNENFPVDAGGKVSFVVDKSEKALYYLNQAHNDLEVSFVEPVESDIEVGKYDRVTDDIIPGAPYICKALSSAVIGGIEKDYYEVLGALNYSTDDLGLDQPNGNRFIIKLRNPNITSRDQVANSGHFIWISDGDTQTKPFGRNAFNEDGSLVVILNIKKPTSQVIVSVQWDKDAEHNGQVDYEFTFTNVIFGKEGEVYPDLQNVDINTDQKVILENKTNRAIGFIPYRENFIVDIAKEDSLVIETKVAEEVMYYLLQADKDLEVTL